MEVKRAKRALASVAALAILASCGAGEPEPITPDGGSSGEQAPRRSVWGPCPSPIPEGTFVSEDGRCYTPPEEDAYDPDESYESEGSERGPERTD